MSSVSFERRAQVAVLLAALFGSAIIAKLFCEQVVLQPSRLALADMIFDYAQPPDGQPGEVCTADGQVLATSVVRQSICANPGAYESDAQREWVAKRLAERTGVGFHRLFPRLCMADHQFCYVARQVPETVLDQVMSLELPGVFTLPEYYRVYPFNSLAANALGFRGADDVGLLGIEREWAFCIDGERTGRDEGLDAKGRLILGAEDQFRLPEPGRRVVLTIRLPLQRIVEAVMDDVAEKHEPEVATCTVLDPRTGEILAITARPNFNPNSPGEPEPAALTCRQAFDVYPPGSTFKPPMIGAAIDAGAITKDTTFTCTGTDIIGGKPLECWGPWAHRGHGTLTAKQAIAKSCNPWAARSALRLGKAKVYEYLHRMHVTETLGSGLADEQPGFLLPPEQQYERGVANIGFGQGVDVTDLHLAAIYGAIANGGIYHWPNIVKEIRTPDGQLVRRREPVEGGRVFKKETAAFLLECLEAAVSEGTGATARIDGLRVGGKTGTSQIYDREKRRFLEDKFVMTFIAVAPIEAPRFVVLVRLDRPKYGEHGSDTAAPAVKRVIEAAMRLSDELES